MPNTFIICNNEEEIRSNASCWGNTAFELSIEDISALLSGKTLASNNGEYGIFITPPSGIEKENWCLYHSSRWESKK